MYYSPYLPLVFSTKPKLGPEDLLFPVSARVGGIERKTHKMVQHDLESACMAWLKEAQSPQEQEAREKSDFLACANHAGRFTDFHSCRHLFITSLARAGIRPKVAQTLAPHSDIRLTLKVDTHAETADQAAAIGVLPGPPAAMSC